MNPRELPDRVKAFIEREGLFAAGDRLLIAVSGGLDSTTLAHLMHDAGYSIALVHCNYQLRGDDSERDADSVAALATAWGVPLHSSRIGLARSDDDGSIQTEARNRRYEYFRKILDEYHYDVLLTAHHLDDSLETSLINLLRGTGLSGIRGIRPRTDFPLARPLLNVSREEVLAYARYAGITWREDGSNREHKYLRNAIRQRVVPVLRELGLQDDSLRSTLAFLRSAERFVDRGMASVPGVTVDGEVIQLDLRQTGLSRIDTLTLIRQLTARMGFTAGECAQLVDTDRNLLLLTPTHRADGSPGFIRFGPRPAPVPSVEISALPSTLTIPGMTVQLAETDQPATFDEPGCQFCRLPRLPLHLRARRPGDRFRPLGMEGKSKKIQDLFIDDKVPPWERDRVPLLCDAAGEIIAVVGYRIAQSVALTGTEDRVLRITVKEERPDPP